MKRGHDTNVPRGCSLASGVALCDHQGDMRACNELIVINPSDREWLARIGLASVSQVLKYRSGSVAAISGSSETFAIDVDAGLDAPQRIFVKRYAYRGWAARLKGVFRGTLFGTNRAKFEYEFLEEMRHRHIPGVRPIAYGRRRRAGFLSACFLITEGELGAESLDVYAGEQTDSRQTSPQWRQRFIEALGSTVRRMHQAGVMHGGLYWRNILVTGAKDAGWQFHLIDPDRRGRFFPAAVPRKGVVSDLAGFAATSSAFSRRTDVIRFGHAYFGKSRLGEPEKRLLCDVIAAAAKRTAKEGHRVAVGHTIGWLTRRMQQGSSGRQFDSVAAFFDHLAQAWTDGRVVVGPERDATIRFVLQSCVGVGESETYTLTTHGGRMAITHGCGVGSTLQSVGRTEADLTIRTNADAWLAIVSGSSDAFDQIRGARMTLTGDTKLLPFVAKLIEV
ncbi:MAG: lipopolysaccharide kinase InaA family protein [Planctomycetota bacterium]